ncbi:glycosyltransferase family 2 protein, partial [Streptomyces albidoflavus]
MRTAGGRIRLPGKAVNRPAAWCSPQGRPPVGGNAGAAPSVGRVVKLSVVVPFYNVQTYAPDTLTSLRANAREDIEFLLVDDCSSDGTP